MMSLNKVKIIPNNSSEFFLPIVSEVLGLEFLGRIRNCYIWNNEEEKDFCVLYKFSGQKDFIKFEGRLMDGEHYKGHEDYEQYTLYKFRLPSDLKWILQMIKERKVNMLDEESKKKIILFNNKRGLTTEFTKDILAGKFPVPKTYMKDETFSNFLRETKVLDANEIYKRKQNGESN